MIDYSVGAAFVLGWKDAVIECLVYKWVSVFGAIVEANYK